MPLCGKGSIRHINLHMACQDVTTKLSWLVANIDHVRLSMFPSKQHHLVGGPIITKFRFIMMTNHLCLWSIKLALHEQPYRHYWISHNLMPLGMGSPWMIWDSHSSNMEESNADERESAIGFHTCTTFVQGIFKGNYKQILGQVMDLKYLSWIFNLALANQRLFDQTHPPIPPTFSHVAFFIGLTMFVQGEGWCYNMTSCAFLVIVGSRTFKVIYGCGTRIWWCGGAKTWWHFPTFCVTITCHAFNLECQRCSIVPT